MEDEKPTIQRYVKIFDGDDGANVTVEQIDDGVHVYWNAPWGEGQEISIEWPIALQVAQAILDFDTLRQRDISEKN